MARSLRIDLPGVPVHVVQRGVNRGVCFIDDLDREFYLACLAGAVDRYRCEVHSYVLMTNHVHLLVTGLDAGSVSLMMQSLGRQYVRRFNNRHQRTGTLWEGRFKSSPVESDRYLLLCCRYIELNPVRASIVRDPRQFRWSSVHANAYGENDRLLTPHPVYLATGNCQDERLRSYRESLFAAIDYEDITAIRAHLAQSKALGSDQFKDQLEKLTGRSAWLRPPGRPSAKRKVSRMTFEEHTKS